MVFTSPARRAPIPPAWLAVTLLLLAGSVFGWLLLAVLRAGGLPCDVSILEFWHCHATPALDRTAVFLTIVGNTWPMVGLGLLVFLGLLARQQRRAAWVFFAAVGGSMLLTQVIKPLVARPRPVLWASIRPEHTFSFPSGHAMDTAAIATALVFLVWGSCGRGWVWWLAPLFSLAVGWARMYLGVHNPSDVLAGWAAAVAWVAAVHWVARRRRSPPQALR
jgi:membrane-associated phospholipid phosphatase